MSLNIRLLSSISWCWTHFSMLHFGVTMWFSIGVCTVYSHILRIASLMVQQLRTWEICATSCFLLDKSQWEKRKIWERFFLFTFPSSLRVRPFFFGAEHILVWQHFYCISLLRFNKFKLRFVVAFMTCYRLCNGITQTEVEYWECAVGLWISSLGYDCNIFMVCACVRDWVSIVRKPPFLNCLLYIPHSHSVFIHEIKPKNVLIIVDEWLTNQFSWGKRHFFSIFTIFFPLWGFNSIACCTANTPTN